MVVFSHRRLDERGIEPRNTPKLDAVNMLREYYTTKPFAQCWLEAMRQFCYINVTDWCAVDEGLWECGAQHVGWRNHHDMHAQICDKPSTNWGGCLP